MRQLYSQRHCLLGVVLVFLLGCKNPTLPPEANPDEARRALTTALDTWKKGGDAREVLAGGNPPIYFNEPKCSPSVILVDYQLDESHSMYGQTARIAVTLSIKNKDGKVEEKKTVYMIDTAPAIVIVP